MSTSIYVGNVSFRTTPDDLIEAFGKFGTVTRVQVNSDLDTGFPRCFGTVEMSDGAEEAIAQLHGSELQESVLIVHKARSQQERPVAKLYVGQRGKYGRRCY